MSGQEILDGYFLVLTRKAGEQLAGILDNPMLNRSPGGERVLRSVLCRFLNLGAVVKEMVKRRGTYRKVTVVCVAEEPAAVIEVILQLTDDPVRQVEGKAPVKKKLAFVLEVLGHELIAAA